MTAEQAAIQRATLQAHRAVVSLDARAREMIRTAYRAAAADITRRIEAAARGADATVNVAALRDLLAQVEARLRELGRERDQLLNEALEKSARYGARVWESAATTEVAAATGKAAAGIAAAPLSRHGAAVVEATLRFVHAFVADDGLKLSDRIWRIDRGARDAVVGAIERAVIEGQGAAQAARDLLARGEPVPEAIAQKMRGPVAGVLGREAAAQLTGRGGAMDNAMRVMRTEINRAHGEAYMATGEDNPYFGGWRYLLSPQHPEPDICDLLSEQNLYGLGRGVYPNRARCPWPAHPNTLSFVVAVFKQQITDADRAGKETPMQALARLSPESRRGVLGKHKAELYDDGRLTQGMIRAPWRTVQQRVAVVRSRSDAWEWDHQKNETNLSKHGLDFADAPAMFARPTLTRLSPRTHTDERRWETIGRHGGETLLVVYTERSGRTRVISFRRASKKERAAYDRKKIRQAKPHRLGAGARDA